METYDQTGRPQPSATPTEPSGRLSVRRLLSRKKSGWVSAGLLVAAVGLCACGGTSSAPAATTTTTTTTTAAHGAPSGSGNGGSNARSGPAAGGSIGKVTSVSKSGFGLLTSAGEKVTVKETSSTTYKKGTGSTSASAVSKGKTALVLGTTNSTTITATQVIVQPPNSTSKGASKVVPFKRGAPSTAKKVGQIPANYKEGSGTIVSGTTANKATKAGLAAYPGGIVDRVVKLSNGEYEDHYIGVNWPHHIFVTNDYKVVGAY
jgi:hypothetical protein